MSTGVMDTSRIRLSTSRPLRPGIRMSSTTTSGLSLKKSWRPSSPSSAARVSHSCHWNENETLNASRIPSSSSTISNFIQRTPCRVLCARRKWVLCPGRHVLTLRSLPQHSERGFGIQDCGQALGGPSCGGSGPADLFGSEATRPQRGESYDPNVSASAAEHERQAVYRGFMVVQCLEQRPRHELLEIGGAVMFHPYQCDRPLISIRGVRNVLSPHF